MPHSTNSDVAGKEHSNLTEKKFINKLNENKKVKRQIYILFLLLSVQLYAQNHTLMQDRADCTQKYYDIALDEIVTMLDEKQPLSIARAVFLAEWAYLDGKLDYQAYCDTINSAKNFIQKFIRANQSEKYKTGKNMALVEYFFNPYSGNSYKPFIYDFKDDGGIEDFTKQFVTKVMQTHTGQCRSLPYYYRVLAEAIDAEAYIAYAPAHVFIRYRNEDKIYPEDWVNVELTTHQLTPEFWIKENFEITDKTIENRVYLYPLTAKETVAAQLADLAFGYWNKYKIYNNFTLNCAEKSLEYYPQNPKALLIKGKSLEAALMNHLKFNGNLIDEYTTYFDKQLSEVSKRLENLGWEPMRDELFNKLENGIEEGKKTINKVQ